MTMFHSGIPEKEPAERVERRVLGGLLRYSAAINEVAAILTPEHFRADQHQQIYRAMLRLWDANKPIDLESVTSCLYGNKPKYNANGYLYLVDLWDQEPTGALTAYYAGIVKSWFTQRELVRVGTMIAGAASTYVAPVEDMLESAEREVLAIGERGRTPTVRPISEVIGRAYDALDERRRHPCSGGLNLGFRELDALLGGLSDGAFVILAARPSVGKTALATSFFLNFGRSNQPAVFFSLEQPHIELAERMLSAESKLSSLLLRSPVPLSDWDVESLAKAGTQLRNLPLFVDDHSPQSYQQIAATARRLKRTKSIRAVVIDYLQLIEPEDRKANRQEQIATISRRLKGLARELAAPVICLAQLNRELERRADKRPMLSDLRESGAIEADADLVMLLHKPPERMGEVDVTIAKYRNGPTGTVHLRFVAESMRFEDWQAMI